MRNAMRLALAAVLAGCASGLGKNLRVDNIIQAETPRWRADEAAFPKVRVGKFEDRRQYTEVGEVDGRLLQPAGNVAVNVQAALEEMLGSHGVQPSQFSGPLLTGQIKEWRVRVAPDFPATRVSAAAGVRIELRDADYNVLYAATYSGNGEAEHPFMTQDKVERVLGEAMETALSGVVEDRELMDRIAGGR